MELTTSASAVVRPIRTSARILGFCVLALFPAVACVPAESPRAPETLASPSAELRSPDLEKTTPALLPLALVEVAPAPPPAWPFSGPSSEKLPSGMWNPMPGGVVAGYRADTGLDIMGIRKPVYAIGSGFIDYAETG